MQSGNVKVPIVETCVGVTKANDKVSFIGIQLVIQRKEPALETARKKSLDT